ncbi:hypothetical protein [Capsulimonas corticalis]|nr:hypothetical protein [Capsulimonas corticalis]
MIGIVKRMGKSILPTAVLLACCALCVCGCGAKKTEDQATREQWEKYKHPTPEMLAKLNAQQQASNVAPGKRADNPGASAASGPK